MGTLIVTRRDGEQQVVEAEVGLTVMEAIRDSGIDELLALCGGCCSCATCHVVIDPAWIDKVGRAVGDESDLLESSENRSDRSRLSCQIRLDAAMDGLRVTIAPED